jgi:DNA polymerase-3 subunit chi
VDFYVLDATDPAARLRFACRLAEKAWHLSHRVHLRAGSGAEAEALDELLWTFRQGSFIPHELLGSAGGQGSPVTVGTREQRPPATELLINLAADPPEAGQAVERIAEIVDASASGRAQGRERFRFYRQLGITPTTHEMGTP